MPFIPAVCDKCGSIRLSDVKVKDCTCHIKDHIDGVCQCGGNLRVLGGTYSHLGGPLNYCRASQADLTKFRDMCRKCGVELHQP
jgi:hypothetical protein